MSKVHDYPLKYPWQVYQATRVDTLSFQHCSDLKTDFILCFGGKHFMENKTIIPSIGHKMEFSDSMFDSKTSSDGTKFYKAKDTRYCSNLRTFGEDCLMKSLDVINKSILINAYLNDKEKFKQYNISPSMDDAAN